jgi:hypothetical protein
VAKAETGFVTAEMSHSTAQFLFFNSEDMGRMSTGF